MNARKASQKKAPAKPPNAPPPISATTFPALRQFLRGYLHQDWKEDYDSPAEAAQQFCDEADPQERQQVAREWHAFRHQTKKLSLPAISQLLSSQLGAAWEAQNPAHLEAISAVFRPFGPKT